MEQDKDEEIKKNHGEVTTGVSQYLPPQMLITKNIPENLNHDEKYIQYNIFENIFELTAKYKSPIKFLGRGAYGVVCSAVNSKTNETVAIKKIMHAFDCNISARRTLREIMILRHFKHENIIGIKDIILPARRYDYEDVYIAYEFMDTDLYEVIRSKNELDKVHYELFLYQILRELKYIHSANVIHRDLKPSNLLVNAKCELKICDFGLARGSSDSMTEYVVTRWYRAPELLLNSCAYTAAIDVWAVGCIFMELINREPLFPGDGTSHQLRLIMELIGTPSEDELGSLNEYAKQYLAQAKPLPRQSFSERFPNVPPLAIDLMEKMLQFDPRRRISVEDALTHPYLTTMHDPNDEPECMTPFNNELEEHPLTVEQLREMIYCEALSFSSEQAITENEH